MINIQCLQLINSQDFAYFLFNNKFIKQMINKQRGTRRQIQSKKLPRQQIQKITQRQYQKAMKHLQRVSFNQLNKTIYTEPLDPQCTFQPQIYFIKRGAEQKGNDKDIPGCKNNGIYKPQQRLIQWGVQKSRKRLQNILMAAVQVQKIKQEAFKKTVQKRRRPQYESKSFYRTGQSQISFLFRNKFKSPSKFGTQKKSQKTFMSSTNVKSKSSLLSRLLQ